MPRDDLRAEGDRELAERLLAEGDVQDAIERLGRRGQDPGARRHLLATATRLTREMAPDIQEIMDECRRMLGVEAPLEIYVYPEPMFNAAAVRPEQGRLFLLLLVVWRREVRELQTDLLQLLRLQRLGREVQSGLCPGYTSYGQGLSRVTGVELARPIHEDGTGRTGGAANGAPHRAERRASASPRVVGRRWRPPRPLDSPRARGSEHGGAVRGDRTRPT